jgi:UDP-GlcNAc:undecaprenyl-phosphate/decaprenyl-phosphate GlcNAc-1-phosphate transferase
MMTYGLTFLLSLTTALAMTPLARRTAINLNIVDNPGGRKAHHAPIPYLGGVAIWVAFIAILFAGWAAQSHSSGISRATGQLLAIVGGASLMAVLGLLDDWYDLPALVKLGGQLLGAGILVAAQVTIQFNHHEFAILETPVTIIWVVGITNALNLMDNMDGLAVGTAGIAACFFVLHAVLALPAQSLVATLSAALAGACFGFLYYNWSPAKIFMGDAGSLFLGYMLAAVALKLSLTPTTPQLASLAQAAGYSSGLAQNLHAVALLAPVFVLGLPIFDTTLVTVSRLRRHVPISHGGHDHLSHRLVGSGLSHREAVMTLYLAGCGLGGLSLLLTRSNLKEGAAITVVALIAAIGLLIRFEQLYTAQTLARATRSAQVETSVS